MFILKNPSTADENTDDPTLKWVVGWTYRNNIHNFTICNLYAYVDAGQDNLKNVKQDECIGKSNNDEIKKCLMEHEEIILGWGGHKPLNEKDYDARIKEVLKFEEIKNKELFKVGECPKEEYPRHPLYHWFYKTNMTKKSPFNLQIALDRLNDKYT